MTSAPLFVSLLASELFPLSEGDLAWLAGIEQRSQFSPWQERHFSDSLQAGYDAWGVRRGSIPLGFVFVLHAPDASHLLNIAVAPETRRQGLGAFLLRHAMKRAADAGNAEMFLEARASNAPALAFYRSFGFQQVGVRKGYYPASMDSGLGLGSGREDALVLRAMLPVLKAA